MPYYVVAKVVSNLNGQKKTTTSSRILVLGLAYKKDIDDTRESPSLKIIELLEEQGATVAFNDPDIPKIDRMLRCDLTKESLNKHDSVVISTDHSTYDYDLIHRHASLIVDTRHASSKYKKSSKPVQA